MKGYCLDCSEETEIIVEKTILDKDEKKIKGRCINCNSYVCRILSKESPEVSGPSPSNHNC